MLNTLFAAGILKMISTAAEKPPTMLTQFASTSLVPLPKAEAKGAPAATNEQASKVFWVQDKLEKALFL